MSKAFKVVTDSVFEPFTLSEAKDFLRVDLPDDDAVITSIIKQARYRAEQYTGIGITLKTVEQRFNAFSDSIQLTLGNGVNIVHVKYLDEAQAEQTLSSTVYGFDDFIIPCEVYLKPNQAWPKTSTDRNAIRIQYRAGWADAASIPADIKAALNLMIADAYEHREDSVQRFPTAAQNYLELHRQKFFV